MISITQRNELEKIKPPKYREKVREFLIQNGHKFSLETIQKVYSGKRKNLIIARAIITVFNNHLKEQESIDSELKNLIKQIKKD
ncbi:hypothetical protein F7018_10400 [Tenacibaculum aiptasiae]|uniref:Uncharacterized protein n=1 Tax=Tenacibaculum aiptasiae TaxID=426481 RepID=A0A7J5AI97_9FLAO|nr:hypothetical protein [Tenacibaculum aiptasiae]KAB1157331.1 hypothetical protein F7018_10400 [Tenacibaculum aiptasiae]